MKGFAIPLVAALSLGLAAGIAPAQDAQGLREFEDDDAQVPGLGLSADELEDMDVYGPGGEQIGEAEEVLADASGAAAGLAVETEGFLGIGGDDVVLTLDQARVEDDRLVTALTEEQLEALPRWED